MINKKRAKINVNVGFQKFPTKFVFQTKQKNLYFAKNILTEIAICLNVVFLHLSLSSSLSLSRRLYGPEVFSQTNPFYLNENVWPR